jgi:hypothetical protein
MSGRSHSRSRSSIRRLQDVRSGVDWQSVRCQDQNRRRLQLSGRWCTPQSHHPRIAGCPHPSENSRQPALQFVWSPPKRGQGPTRGAISSHSLAWKLRGKNAPPAHWPSSSWWESSSAPHPSTSTLLRSIDHSDSGASSKSRMTCHLMDASDSSNQPTTAFWEHILNNHKFGQQIKLLDVGGPRWASVEYARRWMGMRRGQGCWSGVRYCRLPYVLITLRYYYYYYYYYFIVYYYKKT